MVVGIITQPLLNNYGGVLQNYALQTVLNHLGYSSKTVDWLPPKTPLYRYILSWIKTILLNLVGKKRNFVKMQKKYHRKKFVNAFIQDYIAKTTTNYGLSSGVLSNTQCLIVGSDQVWRPKYNPNISNMFLDFCKKKKKLKRIAYAASFGVDVWEYSPKQNKICSLLAKKFDAISVREESGIRLCKDYLGVNATWVLDPTLLLKKEDYQLICKEVPFCKEEYLAVYVLDENEKVTAAYEKEAISRRLVVKKFYADSKSTLTIPEWLAMFRDASYVVTDSFHGTIFSIIFGKEFKCVYNEGRGAARFESLLNLYNSGKLEEMREFSLNWLKKALES